MRDLAALRVPANGTMMDAIRAIDRGGVEIAFAVDFDGRVLGTVTDGDIRRDILRGSAFMEPYTYRRSFTAVGPEVGRAEVLDIMQARGIAQVPVLDEEGRLVGLHLLREILGAVERPNWAVVMAGGLGTRLRPLTDAVPKPMLKVAGRPILERIVLHLVSYGIRRVFLSVNYKAEVIEQHFGDGSRFGCRIEYLREEKPMGTAGALSLLPEKPSHPLIVMNGDLVTQANLGAMLDAHGGYQAITMGVRQYVHRIPYGCVTTDGDGLVSLLREKPDLSVLVNAGIYILDPCVVESMRLEQDHGRLDQEVFMTEVVERWKTGIFEIADEWTDIGRPDELRRARGAA